MGKFSVPYSKNRDILDTMKAAKESNIKLAIARSTNKIQPKTCENALTPTRIGPWKKHPAPGPAR